MDLIPDSLELPPVTWAGVGTGALVVLAAAVLAWLVSLIARRLFAWRGRSPSSAEVFGRLLGWLIVALGLGAALTIVFPSVRPVDILGGVGVLSIAAGIAFQTVLGNVFAGLVILARDRYRVGDQVRVRDHAGTVVKMGLTSTSIRTFDGRLVLLPNGILHSEPVTVQTGFEYVRTSVPVEIDDTADIDLACRVATEAMRAVPEVLDDPAPVALLTEIGTATVTLELLFWSGARQLETREATHEVIRRVVRELGAVGIAVAADTHVVEPGPVLADLLRERLDGPSGRTGDPA